MLGLLLAAALAADAGLPPPPPGPARALEAPDPQDWEEDWSEPPEDPVERRRRLSLTILGGQLFAAQGSGRDDAGALGAEMAFRFEWAELGVLAQGYRIPGAEREWTPVVLARFTQRFLTARGVEAGLGVGFGGARTEGWRPWYQVTVGVRLSLGAVFLAGEAGLETDGYVRLAGGLGVAF